MIQWGKELHPMDLAPKTRPISPFPLSSLKPQPQNTSWSIQLYPFPPHSLENTSPLMPLVSQLHAPPMPQHCSIHQYDHLEYLELKAKGLCFHCKQPYSPLHECPNKSSRALLASEDEPPYDTANSEALVVFHDSRSSLLWIKLILPKLSYFKLEVFLTNK